MFPFIVTNLKIVFFLGLVGVHLKLKLLRRQFGIAFKNYFIAAFYFRKTCDLKRTNY